MADGSSNSGGSRGLNFRFNFQAVNPHLTAAANAPARIRDDLHHMIRGLNPFLNERSPQATISRLLNQSRTSQAHLSPSISSPSANRDSFVINVDEPITSPETVGNDSSDARNNNSSPAASTDNSDSSVDLLRQSPELRAVLTFIERYVPFVLILFGKLLYDHKAGILILLGLVITFSNANSIVKREVGKQAKRNLSSLAAVTINLLTCIIFIYYIFDSDKLYYSLIFLPPTAVNPFTTWDLLWIVGVTDFVLKLITVLLKIAVVATPPGLIPLQKKGKYYLFIEQTSQLYRCATPTVPWMYYLMLAYEGASKLVGVILTAAYLVSKSKDMLQKVLSWKAALVKLMQSVSYGNSPSKDQVDQIGNLCPICQDDLQQPTMLHCKHIFCEECVTMWFDRERTCPMCRAQVADDPSWRDGATTHFVQLF